MNPQPLWRACLEYFNAQLPAQQFNSWIKPIAFDVVNDVVVLTVPNSFTLKIIQERFLPDIKAKIEEIATTSVEIELRVDSKKLNTQAATHPKLLATASVSAPVSRASSFSSSHLNASYQFENYVIGKTNQLAHAAAIQVAESVTSAYNPLFIYGGVGLGKTHLLQAIGNQFKLSNENAKICYVHATNYISSVVKAFQTKQFDQFKQFYNTLDLLLIDDIQFIADKPGTQQEFFYTLNSLIDIKKQVVITCDTFPKEISGIEPRLTSRFTSGLTVAIEPPSLEMRVAILLRKASFSKNPISEEIAFFIAKHVRSNIRELEGALNRIDAFARFHKREMTVELAKEALSDLILSQKKQVSIENIQKTVANFYRIKLVELLSKKRTRNFARPRQIAMSLARELTQLSLPEIGNSFGGRDHSTVLHACKTIETLRESDSSLNADYLLLVQTLRN
jgi:chromosomal replication initiator protein